MKDKKLVRVLFVCLGNICRSPTAEGVFTKLVRDEGLAERIEIDSAGTAGWHVGRPPDERARASALGRGIDIGHLRGRQVAHTDFEYFDYLLAMDSDNYADLKGAAPLAFQGRIHKFLNFAPEVEETDVPDPYYGGDAGFEHVLDLVEAASRGLLADIRRNHGL